ncbi:MAG: uroporphyrinogen-III synthase [Planctomycetota bacterium]
MRGRRRRDACGAAHAVVGDTRRGRAVGPCGSVDELEEAWATSLAPGETVLWPRSELAAGLDAWITGRGAEVAAPIAYANRPRLDVDLPEQDAVFFASPSAVHAFALHPAAPRTHLAIAIGATTFGALEALRLDRPDRLGKVDRLPRPDPESLRELLGGG